MKKLSTISLLAIFLATAVPAAAANLTYGPYLQLLTTTSVTVAWGTDVAALCGVSLHRVGGTTSVVRGLSGTTCAVKLSGLTPGTSYGYVPLAADQLLRSESIFRTDAPTLPHTFLVLGDSGNGGSNQMRVRDRMLGSPADFILHTGDMIYDDGQTAGFAPYFFKPYADLIRKVVFWPCLGNHDIRTSSGAPWRSFFYTPANNAARSENYYSFDHGNAHVVVLDSNASTSASSAQGQFLDADLAASRARWKFVAFHHTIYSSGSHGSAVTIRNNLVPIFDRHGVDVVLMGHDHHYERTVPLRANNQVPAGQGTVYITTGGGGKEIRPVGSSSFTAYAESAYHFTRIAINGDTLTAEMVRADGQIRDRLTLRQDGAPPTTTTTLRPPATTTTSTTRAPTTTTRASTTTTRPAGSTTTTTLRTGAAVSTVLLPMADTYIEAGTEGNWDHGASDHLDVDVSPFGVTYLKFDLRGVAAPITNVTLTLTCSNASRDGGTFYPVANSGWVEGDRSGIDGTSANGPGLKFTQVDTNGDGKITSADTSPYVPNFSRPLASLAQVNVGDTRTVDVTAGFQAGPGIYTLALVNTVSDGSTFGSRNHPEATRRPLLRVGGGGGSVVRCGDGVRGGTEQCDGGDAASCPGLCRTDCTCAPAPGGSPFACLGQAGPTITLSGTRTSTYSNRTLLANTKIDARAATFLAGTSNLFPLNLDGAAGVCLAGGKVLGSYDRNWTWQQMHDRSNTGLRFQNDRFTVDGLRVDNVTDGVRPTAVDSFTIRQAWFSYVRDDCVENDHMRPGLIEDSLFDGCYVGIAERPSTTIINEGWDGRGKVLTIRRTLIRLQPYPGPDGYSASVMGHGQFFKWHELSTSLALHDNVFMAEQSSMGSGRNMGVNGPIASCSNNIMVWLGPGAYPAPLPSCFTVTRDRAVWDRAVADWKARHPHVGRP